MLQITVNDILLDLNPDSAMQIDESNPIFNDRASMSLPLTVPATPTNLLALGLPTRLDNKCDFGSLNLQAAVVCGLYSRVGVLNITDAHPTEGISLNIGFDVAKAYADWGSVKLHELLADVEDTNLADVRGEMESIGKYGFQYSSKYAYFPIAVGKKELGDKEYWEILNHSWSSRVTRVVNNSVSEVYVPQYYGNAPFVRVGHLLSVMFEHLGYKIRTGNPFGGKRELGRLVVLHSCADALCIGKIKLADLLPDCTVLELLDALRVRFGLIYRLDDVKGTVSLALIKDIIARNPDADLRQYLTAEPKLTHNRGQYLTLTAGFSLEGSEPSAARWEDFSHGCTLLPTESSGGELWQIRDADPGKCVTDSTAWQVYRRQGSGNFSKFNIDRYTEVETSSPFFDWNPATPGLEPMELSSPDQWVPIVDVPEIGFMPYLSCGGTHLHTEIRGVGENSTRAPLTFMLAYAIGQEEADKKSIGRHAPVDEDGAPIREADSVAVGGMTLYFQFKDGLFDRFWRGYDELLRHATVTAEFPAAMPISELANLDMCTPKTLDGVRLLLDTASYDLTNRMILPVDVTARSITPAGEYDIDREQGVPSFSPFNRQEKWVEDVGALEGSPSFKRESTYKKAADKAEEEFPGRTQWKDADGTTWGVRTEKPRCFELVSARFLRWVREDTFESLDKDIDNRADAVAEVVYDVYATDYFARNFIYVGRVTIEVDYVAQIAFRWVNV